MLHTIKTKLICQAIPNPATHGPELVQPTKQVEVSLLGLPELGVIATTIEGHLKDLREHFTRDVATHPELVFRSFISEVVLSKQHRHLTFTQETCVWDAQISRQDLTSFLEMGEQLLGGIIR